MKLFLILTCSFAFSLYAQEKITISVGCMDIDYVKVEQKNHAYLYRTELGLVSSASYKNNEISAVSGCYGLVRANGFVDEHEKIKDPSTYLSVFTVDTIETYSGTDGSNKGRFLYCLFGLQDIKHPMYNKLLPIYEWNEVPTPMRLGLDGKAY